MGIGPIGNHGMVPELGRGENHKKEIFDNVNEHLKLPPPGKKTENRNANLRLNNSNMAEHLPNPLVRNPRLGEFFANVLIKLKSGG